jgi:hypothetical protein
MKNLSIRISLAVCAALLIFTSCEEGTGGSNPGGNADSPSVSITGSDVTVAPGDTVYVTVSAVEGDSPLNALTVTENGSNVPLDRLLLDGALASANPQLIVDASEKVSFTREVGVIIPSDGGTAYSYVYLVSDEDMLSESQTIFVTIAADPPTFDILGDGDIQTAVNALTGFNVVGTANGAAMNTISVTIDGVNVDQFTFNGTDVANPYTLIDAERQSFETSMLVRSPMMGGDYTVEVTVTDELGRTVSDQIIFVTGTTAVVYLDRRFFNAIGSGNGAIDLDTGENVSSNSTESELQDDGIDDTIDPTVQENWFASFSPENGADLSLIVAGENGVGETWTFDGVDLQEDVRALRSNGTALTSSGTVTVGQTYLITRDANVYLIRIDEVNYVDNDNEDNYVIDIKLGQ